ncbi:hypothetical protein JDV02_008757 [Purpureocillium takamizusanense]|uniref:Uncharacterized protein n=1 Tax=Purpureocillium takamizusanense TaxID=2060973 RepID=A0A9Q8QNI8_9HYPO|nr:uncharacterized protein JDV02_008757 [Purpureocillium takamizusanense]UNI22913.1 hypothetical protein JDV02_008757 [Purpureocillium takamizusanense]
MPVQRTFTVLQPLGGGHPPDAPPPRPMTSKQVRAAHKAATRMPKMSRAERIRQEKEEQERIRKELDKERASSRARAARQRKRDKEETERQAKRRNGLPLVTVRPSQDTISKFVRGNGTAKKRDAVGEPVLADCGPTVQHGDPSNEAASPVVEETAKNSVEPRTETKEQELDLIPEEDELDLEMLDHLENMTRVPLTTVAETVTARQPTHHEVDLGLRPNTLTKPLQENLEPVRPPDHSMPAKQSSARHPPASPSPTPSPPRQQPPLSTQAILCNYDDFFPSPSQQERELLEDDFINTPTTRHPCQRPDEVTNSAARVEVADLARATSSSTTPAPKRFFSASGSNELYSLALHRNRRDAALDSIRRRERESTTTPETHRHQPPPPPRPSRPPQPGYALRTAHQPLQGNPKPSRAGRPASSASSSQQRHRPLQLSRPLAAAQTIKTIKATKTPPQHDGKENAAPNNSSNNGAYYAHGNDKIIIGTPSAGPPTASQETDYGGGDWVDEIALELTI